MSEYEVEAVLAAHQRMLDGRGSCRCGAWPPADREVEWPTHLTEALAPLIAERERVARAEALRSPYDEDGYCEGCGNGSWKPHAPNCGWADLHDARAEVSALLDRLEAAEAERDKYLAAFSEQFDQREEYAVECKRLWRMEARVELLAETWESFPGSIRAFCADDLRAALGAPQPADAPEGHGDADGAGGVL